MKKVHVEFWLEEPAESGLGTVTKKVASFDSPTLAELTKAYSLAILRTLEGPEGSRWSGVAKAAKLLGIGRATLYRRIDDWNDESKTQSQTS